MDVVYVVREAEQNEELRYSLRSLANVPHDKVFIAGYTPPWTRNVIPIKRRQMGRSKYLNTTLNLLAACKDPRVSEDFILMNDDFFILQPIPGVPARHRGPVNDVLAKYLSEYGGGEYIAGMRATRDLLKSLGFNNPLSYELHIPMVINKEKFLQMYQIGKHLPVLHKRTLYGNLFEIGGDYMEDVKVTFRKRGSADKTFLSTDERSFHLLGQNKGMLKRFPDKCEYEE